MIPYENLSGNSPITFYDFDETTISVVFDKGYVYLYTSQYTSSENIEIMKALAEEGKGLATYISQNQIKPSNPKHKKRKY